MLIRQVAEAGAGWQLLDLLTQESWREMWYRALNCSKESYFSTTVSCVTLSRLHTLSKPGHLLCKMQAQKLTTDREHSISLACMRPSDWLPVPQSSKSTEEPGEPSRTSHTVFWGFGNSVLLHYHGRPGIHYRTQVALELVIEINLFSNETMAVNHHS